MDNTTSEAIVIYTDGGSRGNPGLGAWAWWVMNTSASGTNHKMVTTNNEMELTAIKEALTYILTDSVNPVGAPIEIRSDSAYSINSISCWSDKWIDDGSIYERPNGQLILEIKDLIKKLVEKDHNVIFTKVKGHSGEPGNEMVDRILNETMDSVISGGILASSEAQDFGTGLKIGATLELASQEVVITAEECKFENGKVILSKKLDSGTIVKMEFDLNGHTLSK